MSVETRAKDKIVRTVVLLVSRLSIGDDGKRGLELITIRHYLPSY